MVRVHQFDKVELVKIVLPETSYDEHEKLARDVSDGLRGARAALPRGAAVQRRPQLRRRQVLRLRGLGAGHRASGSSARRARTSRTSRRAAWACASAARPARKAEFPHTLNASGVALPRTYAALLENHQTERGTRARSRRRCGPTSAASRRLAARGHEASRGAARAWARASRSRAAEARGSSSAAACSSLGGVPRSPTQMISAALARGRRPPRACWRASARRRRFPRPRDPELRADRLRGDRRARLPDRDHRRRRDCRARGGRSALDPALVPAASIDSLAGGYADRARDPRRASRACASASRSSTARTRRSRCACRAPQRVGAVHYGEPPVLRRGCAGCRCVSVGGVALLLVARARGGSRSLRQAEKRTSGWAWRRRPRTSSARRCRR